MSLYFDVAAGSHVGKVRSNNQDSGYGSPHFLVVADGMGGHAGGDIASATTVLQMLPLEAHVSKASPAMIANELLGANSILGDFAHQHPELAGMGTTVTAALLHKNTLSLGHIGDSRAYRLKDGVLEQVTSDHTFVQRLIDEGRIRPEDAATHPQKSVLMRVLGDVESTPEIDQENIPVSVGERWLLCSDGLSGVVSDEGIQHILSTEKNLQTAVDKLIELTLTGGAPDNVTIVVGEIKEGRAKKNIHHLVGAATELERLPVVKNSHPAKVAREYLDTGAIRKLLPAEDSSDTQSINVDLDPEANTGPLDFKNAGQHIKAGQPAATVSASSTAEATEISSTKNPLPSQGNHDGKAETAGAEESTNNMSAQKSSAESTSDNKAASSPQDSISTLSIPKLIGTTPDQTLSEDSAQSAGVKLKKARSQPYADQEPRSFDYAEKQTSKAMVYSSIALALIVGMGALLYMWSQAMYYIGVNSQTQTVAIYRGAAQHVGPLNFSTEVKDTHIKMSSLSEYARNQVSQTISAASYAEAEQIVQQLHSADLDLPYCPGNIPTSTAKGPSDEPTPLCKVTPKAGYSPTGSNKTSPPSGTSTPSSSGTPGSTPQKSEERE